MKKIKERIKETSTIPAECLCERPPVPKSVKIEVTSRCDLKCIFCSVTYKKQPQGDMDRTFLFRLLEDLAASGVQEVGFFWLGEPLLVSDLVAQAVTHAKKAGIRYVFITTNGRLATPERIRPLIDAGIDSIKFSINASTRDEYIRLCGVDAFDRVIQNLQTIKTLRGDSVVPSIYASTVYDPNNPEPFERLKEMIEPFVDEYYPLRLYGKKAYGEKPGTMQQVKARTLASMLPCWSLFTLPHISYDGFLSACYCDHDTRFYMADLKTTSFIDAWHSSKSMELRRQHLKKNVKGYPCEECIAYEH